MRIDPSVSLPLRFWEEEQNEESGLGEKKRTASSAGALPLPLPGAGPRAGAQARRRLSMATARLAEGQCHTLAPSEPVSTARPSPWALFRGWV